MNFLESAGFSRANPYYVVQQGKIMKMSVMKDSERLDLLKEIGGTKVYEERRRESLKIMQENEIRKSQIQEVVDQLDEKLAELDAEREELHKYQQLDKQRRGIEYALHDKELTETRKKLEEIETKRAEASKSVGQCQDEAKEAEERIREIQEEIRTVKASLKEGSSSLSNQKAKTQQLLESKTKASMDLKDAEDRIKSETTSRSAAEQELQGLQTEIEHKEAELKELKAQLAQKESLEQKLENELSECNSRQQFLFGKQGQNFSSKSEKDKWVKAKISEAQQAAKKDSKVLMRINAEMEQVNRQLQDAEEEMLRTSASASDQSAEVPALEQQLKDFKSKAGTLNNRRKELWRDETALDSKCAQLRDELDKKERQLHGAVNFDTNMGLKNVKRIVDENKIAGVHGPLIELIQCDPKLHRAVEVAAGNRLFNYVVDSEEVAATILKHMKGLKNKSGRITIMPLANLSSQEMRYPTEFGKDAIPMLKKIEFDATIKPAVQQIFGKVMICRDLEVASQVARSSQFDSITLDGDRVDTRGPITGGYHDDRYSKMDAMKAIKGLIEQLGKSRADRQNIAEELVALDQEITQCLSNQKQLEARLQHARANADTWRADERAHKKFVSNQKKQLETMSKEAADCQRRMEEQEARAAKLQAELGEELQSHLSAEEEAELTDLNSRVLRLKERLVQAQGAKAQSELAAQELDDLLTGNLHPRQQELQELVDKAAAGTDQRAVQQLREEAAEAESAFKEAKEIEGGLEAEAAELKQKSQELKKELERLKASKESLEEGAREQERQLDSLLSRRTQLAQRRDDVSKRIRELGSLPADAFEVYKGKPAKELHKLLKKVSEDLKQFSHVNKKALEQYVTFTEQREDLLKRQRELQNAEGKIKELVYALDVRKDEAIERTFKGVAKHFREIFSELAPGGRGELVMQKRLPSDANRENEPPHSHREETESQEKYSGVKVRVSFGMGDVQTMQQLSGGQKTMVALTLIFAIQRCDPAPFYLFDEIDAALDSQYRTTVARMLEKQVEDGRNPAQFIVTTFHPQLVQVSEKIYGVSHSNRISRVDVITRDDALAFLASEEVQRTAARQEEALVEQFEEGEEAFLGAPMEVDT
mmetsp:Transcript_28839/g.68899  ORF Transcript_28839/g.68899 Transcript_28839/m.68899 type:complete len:1112 (-) Transcript_28839:128-3463(-)